MKKIDTLQAFRAIFIIGVIIEHMQLTGIVKNFYGGGEGVAFFIVLSGFVMSYAYENRWTRKSIKEQFQFTKNKVSKFYGMHIITLILVLIPLCITEREFIKDYILEFVADAALIQAFIPSEKWYFSLNGVSWYLSATCFFYFVTEYFFRMILPKKDNKKYLFSLAVGVVLVKILWIMLWNKSELHIYMTYVFPIYRSLDYLLGMITGAIFNSSLKNESIEKSKGNIFEFLTVGIWIIAHILSIVGTDTIYNKYADTVFVVVFCFMVYVFAHGCGVLSHLLSNKVLVYFGNISFDIYILHNVIIRYSYKIFGREILGIVITIFGIVLVCSACAELKKKLKKKSF